MRKLNSYASFVFDQLYRFLINASLIWKCFLYAFSTVGIKAQDWSRFHLGYVRMQSVHLGDVRMALS